ncbi:MAG: thioesterase family protein [Anaerostipes sp.]|jgi:fluoroacetyl-CoA thioesterase|nr:thioesterase family protein [Anaerostipes sp.]
MDLKVGDEIELSEVVTTELTAQTWGSGSLPVYATPAMILLIERASVALLDGKLEEGTTSVGTKLNVSHLSATPLDQKVTCHCHLTEIDRKRLEFHVEITDASGRVGIGTHERFIVSSDSFVEKAKNKYN